MAKRLEQRSQGPEIYCHDLEVMVMESPMESNLGCILLPILVVLDQKVEKCAWGIMQMVECLAMCEHSYGLVIFIIVTMPFHNTQYIMGYNIMAQPHGLTMSL